jgi:hypothetical protein
MGNRREQLRYGGPDKGVGGAGAGVQTPRGALKVRKGARPLSRQPLSAKDGEKEWGT